ncbi:beta strand repeat-containing protein [Pseudoduganella danionis]|uniref:beta strand repeat-containing protein n=1 Tax=Pseudoduganella danionis TaxID=1890295 RepID=UPI003622FA21
MLRLAILSRVPMPLASVHASVLQVTLLGMLALPGASFAAPLDPIVRNGTASFAVNGNVYTVTNTPGTIIDWRQLNVANGELLRFLQQNAQSVVLNRVTGNDPSQILGTLQSNGRVLLINPNGVLFGQHAVVDVAGLIASSLQLSDADFLAGKYNFTGSGGLVSNLGSITTPLGGSVYLIGSEVSNSGLIRAPGGQILLAAGQQVSLVDSGSPALSVTLSAKGNKAINLGQLDAAGGQIDMYGALLDQQGVLRADSSAVDAQGRIVLRASDSVRVSGTLSAANTAGQGGSVQVLGDQVSLERGARIDASGSGGGGSVLVGGDYQGANSALPNARTTNMDAGASIDASATLNGNGGKVVLWSDQHTSFAGSIAARGGAQGGDGGQVETSGHTLTLGGTANTLAPKGKTGNWLLDPAVFCIYASNASECSGAAAAGATSFDTLSSILESSNGTLAATDFVTFLPGGGSGTINAAVPNGTTIKVQAPYIATGSGSSINTQQVAIRLDASTAYGRTTQVDSKGANLSGTIDIGGSLFSSASQTLLSNGGNINLYGPDDAVFRGMYMLATDGSQSLTTTGALSVRAVQLSSSGDQQINAAKVMVYGQDSLVGGSTPVNKSGSILSYGNQLINATEIGLVSGAYGQTFISSGFGKNGAQGGTQSITADTISLTAGSSGQNNSARIEAYGSNAVQNITARTSLNVAAGVGGSSNYAIISTSSPLLNPDQLPPNKSTQTINAGTMTLTGGINLDANEAASNRVSVTSLGSQNITATSMQLNGGSSAYQGTGNQGSYVEVNAGAGGQTVKLSGALLMTGGSGDGASPVSMNSAGDQNISADIIRLQGGSKGNGNAVSINASKGDGQIQTISAGTELSLTGGVAGSNNSASVNAKGVGTKQLVLAPSLNITGGSGGTQNYAQLWNRDDSKTTVGSQTVTAGVLKLQGGTGTDNLAAINGDAVQNISADTLSMLGGPVSYGAGALIDTQQNQTVTVKQALTMRGGAGKGGWATQLGNIASIVTDAGNQTVTAGTIDIQGASANANTLSGISLGTTSSSKGVGKTQSIIADSIVVTGGSVGSSNYGVIQVYGSKVTQDIQATNISVMGGASGNNNVGRIRVLATDNTLPEQTIRTTTLTLQSQDDNSGGLYNFARVTSLGNQSITATDILLDGRTGASGGVGINAVHNQTIVVADKLQLFAGSGENAGAFIQANPISETDIEGTQTISVHRLTATAGSGGVYSHAGIESLVKNQNIILTGVRPELVLTGGSGGANNSEAQIVQAADGGTQKITVNGGGSIKLFGGAGDGYATIEPDATYCPGCNVSANRAQIANLGGGNQTIDFLAGGSLSLTGGSKGAGNSALIVADMSKGAQQTITSSTGAANYAQISLTGGSGGFYNAADGALETNGAMIGAVPALGIAPASALKTINAASITLNGGGSADNRGGAWLAAGQGSALINVMGDLTLQGGASNVGLQGAVNPANAYYTDVSAQAAINPNGKLNLNVGGTLNLLGGSGTTSAAVISGVADQTIVARNLNLTAGSGAGAQIILNADNATQSITADQLALLGSSSGLRSMASISANGHNSVQQINANQSLSITGGAEAAATGRSSKPTATT